MNQLKISPCPHKGGTDGGQRPRHKAKGRNKKHVRSRVIAALNKENDDRGTSFCI